MMSETSTRKRLAHVQHPSGDSRFKLVDRTLERFQFQHDALIEVLHTAQEVFGYLDESLLIYVARQLRLPLSWVLWSGNVLPLLLAEAAGRAHVHRLHGHSVLRQARRRDPVRRAINIRHRGRSDNRRRQAQPVDGPLSGQLRPGTAGRPRRRGYGHARRLRAHWSGWTLWSSGAASTGRAQPSAGGEDRMNRSELQAAAEREHEPAGSNSAAASFAAPARRVSRPERAAVRESIQKAIDEGELDAEVAQSLPPVVWGRAAAARWSRCRSLRPSTTSSTSASRRRLAATSFMNACGQGRSRCRSCSSQ